MDNKYDEHSEAELKAIIYEEGDGRKRLIPVAGIKGQKNIGD
jgi:hypothetical protein